MAMESFEEQQEKKYEAWAQYKTIKRREKVLEIEIEKKYEQIKEKKKAVVQLEL